MYSSALLDGTDYDALDFTSAESKADNLVAVFSDHSELWAFGTDTIEIYYNTGGTAFPFSRINQALIERGCIGKYCIAKEDNTVTNDLWDTEVELEGVSDDTFMSVKVLGKIDKTAVVKMAHCRKLASDFVLAAIEVKELTPDRYAQQVNEVAKILFKVFD